MWPMEVVHLLGPLVTLAWTPLRGPAQIFLCGASSQLPVLGFNCQNQLVLGQPLVVPARVMILVLSPNPLAPKQAGSDPCFCMTLTVWRMGPPCTSQTGAEQRPLLVFQHCLFFLLLKDRVVVGFVP